MSVFYLHIFVTMSYPHPRCGIYCQSGFSQYISLPLNLRSSQSCMTSETFSSCLFLTSSLKQTIAIEGSASSFAIVLRVWIALLSVTKCEGVSPGKCKSKSSIAVFASLHTGETHQLHRGI